MEIEQPHTVNEILDKFEREYVPTLAPRTQKDYGYHLKTLRQWFGHRVADEMKARDFRDFMGVTKAKIQRNRQLAVLSCAFSLAVSPWYMMERNPCRDVQRHPAKARDRYVTDEEFAEFKAMVPLRVRLAMELALLTGQRQGDILGLTWAKVDRAVGRIKVRQSKTGKRLGIRITEAIAELLDRCERLGIPGDHVIRKRNGQRYTSEGFRAIWQRYMRKWVKLDNQRFTFHDIRAKCASDSPTIEAAYNLLGHINMAMTRKTYDRKEREVDPLR